MSTSHKVCLRAENAISTCCLAPGLRSARVGEIPDEDRTGQPFPEGMLPPALVPDGYDAVEGTDLLDDEEPTGDEAAFAQVVQYRGIFVADAQDAYRAPGGCLA